MKDKIYIVYEHELEGFSDEYKEIITKEENRVVSYLTLEEVTFSILREFDITEVKYQDVADLVKEALYLPSFEGSMMKAYGKALREHIERKASNFDEFQSGLTKILEFDKKLSDLDVSQSAEEEMKG